MSCAHCGGQVLAMKPYYQDALTTLYHAKCEDILPHFTEHQFDLLLTDPPYGTGRLSRGGRSGNWGKTRDTDASRMEWDFTTASPDTISLAVQKAKHSIVWGGNYYAMPPSRCWLVWSKPERGFSLAEAELAWTSMDKVVRVFDCRRYDPGKEHPTQKPLLLMEWCLGHCASSTVLDPFAGAGTTLVAAKRNGRMSVGVEMREDYCEMAARRLQATL